ncbi:Atp-dependent clp protease atp-binding subunit [Thalictrum thalictroides]|uniref:Atp-dependent clp protease atp-binding subunit n=1 Tax=Thalictrum thalictroides TaxID=46969 RepID=A0A7J6V897_THATH|nr:Atp-dependent clp protease atp-binding subunit [Thalictrum thalictroides]
MGCSRNPSSSSSIFTKLATKPPTNPFSSLTLKPKSTSNHRICLCSTFSSEQQQSIKTTLYSVKFKTLGDCKLGIARYPDFVYDAEGGLGTGTGTITDTATKEISVSFDLKTLYIPPLNSATTRFLGLPLPPFLKIAIEPQLLQGSINEETGKVDLKFKSKFWFSVGSIYEAPPLVVETNLTSEDSIGTMRRGRGEKLNREGKCKLVGVAKVDPIDDVFMNTFLGLPTECLAVLNATIYISTS